MVVEQSYIVAATPRTGSYLLCEGLEATGIAGRPSEAFTPSFEYLWRERWLLDKEASFSDYLQAAISYGTTRNGVYGFKIHWMHVGTLAQQAGFKGEAANVLEHLFPCSKFVNIVRRDLTEQSLSYLRALQTNEWWRVEGVKNNQRNCFAPVFDLAAIQRIQADLKSQQAAWQKYFREREIKPLFVEYQQLVKDYRNEIARVLQFLDLDASAATRIPPPRLVRQSDELTLRWRDVLETQPSAGPNQ